MEHRHRQIKTKFSSMFCDTVLVLTNSPFLDPGSTKDKHEHQLPKPPTPHIPVY